MVSGFVFVWWYFCYVVNDMSESKILFILVLNILGIFDFVL